MSAHVTEGPVPTRDLETADHDLAEHGVCVVLDAMETSFHDEVRRALYHAADGDVRRARTRDYAYGGDDHVNQRLWNLPSRDPVFCELAEHPLGLRFVEQTLGWPALLSSMSANITAGGGGSMVVHADQGYVPEPWHRPHGINIAWCVDDFTLTNGATRYVPGSHRHQRNRRADEELGELAPLVAPAGSMIAMEGRLWHTNGANTDDTRRAGIFAWYTLPIYLPQENWFLSASPSIRQFGSDTLQTLLGFRPRVLGRINGLDRLERVADVDEKS
ncbi:phytanoyl-CoA dioxygenase family protein [Nocardia bovistercoris]|uniref:Phytanoyl-CoA dioxygenase family protein n=1 Tax=Nocardia bovistercoris TaxID=2785916 RepID=A0A931IDR2_9NOCA|nr:phytanoyl-CoA dioxygenase family protein [Nocardia bovistercoris]